MVHVPGRHGCVLLQCAGSEDSITMKAEDTCDVVSFMFEAPQQERIADFELKLMDIDAEQLGIPDTDYSAQCAVHPSFNPHRLFSHALCASKQCKDSHS